MPNMLLTQTTVLLSGATLLLVLCATVTFRGVTVSHNTADSIRTCLSPDGATTRQLLEERARANTRLVKAFNLSNTFVSSETSIHSAFVSQARLLLKLSNKHGWSRFRDLSTQAVRFELGELDQAKPRLSYDVFIQCVCLRVILVGLLGVDASVESFDATDVVTTANHINTLWSLSKRPEEIPSHILPQLTEALRRMIPDVDQYPNPVDFVIPAWETLWRVVAIAIAYSFQDEGMADAFSRLYSRPDVKTFNGHGVEISVKNIVNETMRLHPPSKRIGRMRLRPFTRYLPSPIICLLDNLSPNILTKKESADILTLQRSQTIWGSDADEFNPSRFLCSSSRERDAALQYVFGGGPLRCVGASWAPLAAGIICSAVMASINDLEEFKIVRGSDIGERDGWRGWYIDYRS